MAALRAPAAAAAGAFDDGSPLRGPPRATSAQSTSSSWCFLLPSPPTHAFRFRPVQAMIDGPEQAHELENVAERASATGRSPRLHRHSPLGHVRLGLLRQERRATPPGRGRGSAAAVPQAYQHMLCPQSICAVSRFVRGQRRRGLVAETGGERAGAGSALRSGPARARSAEGREAWRGFPQCRSCSRSWSRSRSRSGSSSGGGATTTVVEPGVVFPAASLSA